MRQLFAGPRDREDQEREEVHVPKLQGGAEMNHDSLPLPGIAGVIAFLNQRVISEAEKTFPNEGESVKANEAQTLAGSATESGLAAGETAKSLFHTPGEFTDLLRDPRYDAHAK